ncbi:DNA-formamidopyrimidine glycosylase [Maritimibacter sp. 55A14]|uniref:bifunctional DNA-formamidopyrimidine glycosylase/DNA-(apurinic or apyrimidinic site) lyase n=1 Tax=Maritimibacter sp. 55A14 TaxID=2174844 RepID=UPI000D613F29|nr:bifunctional DNA-formamidopyrimidine glycosylase/DNA-(apurinic or apyrimidinic site) lyase [Maritimibacter sp. 55A14]PWE32377.1 DNA-formamidopyrimidine glycosylase [Maritimibacter sp. 55A14]
MPELPEVETVRRGLEPVMAGRIILRVETRRPDLRWPLPARMAERLTGRRVLRLGRRSKYLLADLDSDETLIVHLGMSGRLLVSLPQSGRATVAQFLHAHPAPQRHDHVVLDMESGARITFNDARRFGAMDLVATDAVASHRLLAGLGPEPLGNDFHETYLAARLAGRRMPMKAALLDQRVVAGLGNIYVCEALWRAGISPRRKAGNLSEKRISALTDHIRATLRDAIDAGGSSLRDYRQTDGELGYFQHTFAAYGRAGEPCRKSDCAGVIGRIVQSGRSTFYCPKCQR